jgi:hypothetical protein
MRLFRPGFIILAILLAFVPFVPVKADTASPDATPTIESFNAYRNLRQTGDFLLVIYANIPYADNPSTPVTETFIWRLYDTDNASQLGSTVGSVYQDSGYGYNIYSMYFDNTTAPTWGLPYIIKLCGNPLVFAGPPTYSYQLSSSDYSSITDSTLAKAELAARVVAIAQDLNIKWGLTSSYFLTSETETGTVLSTYGETVFRSAIYGLQALAPAAFSFNIKDLNIASRTWSETYSQNLSDQWAGTWVQTAKEAGATLFGTSYDLLSLIILAVLCIGVMMADIVLGGGFWAGAIDASVVAISGSKLGLLGLGYLGLVVALAVIWIGFKLRVLLR